MQGQGGALNSVQENPNAICDDPIPNYEIW